MGNPNFTPRQVIDRAIGMEEEARMMYEIYGEKVDNAQARSLLEELAKEELGHKLALEKIDPDNPVTFKTAELSSREIGEIFDRPQITKEATIEEVLRYAISEETEAFNFYNSLAAYVGDQEFLNLLKKLASEEKRHKQKLEQIYDDMFRPEN